MLIVIQIACFALTLKRVSSPLCASALGARPSALAEKQSLVIDAVSDLVTCEVMGILQLCVELLDLLKLHTQTTCLKHASVNHLYFSQRFEFVIDKG